MTRVGEHEVRLLEQRAEAPGVATFRFEKPEGYAFAPGQHMTLTVDTPEGRQGKPFTISASPQDPWLEMTTRLTGSPFKRALSEMAVGATVLVSDPIGRMTLPVGTGRAAFLVGGVGVTPARSILRDAAQRQTGLQAFVFYGNLDQDNIPFKAEFEEYAQRPEMTFVHVLLSPQTGWDGETGFITADVVRRHMDPLDGWHWVVAGPPAMIEAMGNVLDELAVPAERISVESFAGYGQASPTTTAKG